MSNQNTAEQDSVELEKRTRRALERVATVLHTDGTPIAAGDDPSMVAVESGNSGREHTVDLREERCTCADHRHRGAECYHLRRAKIALGIRPVATAELAAADVAGGLAEHAPGPKVLASDGGVVGGDGAELVDDDAAATWKGPFPEYNRYGEPTGARYVRCSECGVEVLEGETEHATHRTGCDGVGAAESFDGP
ncbi:hypothetical protein [Halorubrum ezzemoulense]|uniref:hypothetical protein n=1 Tax=Halorubrum ezzemoulense TaxID=337243 RepID=UPI00232C4DD7|nr:hypothetical protein [Halorubrum ezzemoulense]MDB9235815.1 hypothetical protein [Halorubrum ezzemoulense]